MSSPPATEERIASHALTSAAVRRVRWSSGRVQLALATLAYVAYTVVVTWPVARDLGGSILGAPPGDIGGSIAHYREIIEHGLFPFAPATLPDFNAPQGQPEQWVLNLASLPSTAVLYGLSLAFGSTTGHTLFTLAGYVVSGSAMFLLARRLTGSAIAAFIAGFAFAFYPFAIAKGLGHPHFVHGWPFVLVAWRMLELIEAPTRRNGLLAGAAVALTMWFTPYYILFGGVEFAALAALALVLAWARRRLRPTVASLVAACAFPAALLVGMGSLQVAAGSSATGGIRHTSESELTTYAARIYEFVIPDRNNPIFGHWTEPYLTERLHGSSFSESSLYIGLSVLLLAAFGIFATLRRVRGRWRNAVAHRTVAGAAGAFVVAASAFVLSAPPKVTVFGQLVPSPAWFVYQFTSTWRVYSRFVVLVALGVALLAALGIAALLARRSRPMAAVVAVVLLMVVGVDLWARTPDRVTKLETPEIYSRLAPLPRGIVAQYPILPAAVPDARALWYQDAYDKPLLNGYPPDSEAESRKLELVDLADRETAGDLAAWGVRYVLVASGYPGGRPRIGRDFTRLYENADGLLLEVAARPSRSMVDALGGFWPVEGAANTQFRWLGSEDGKVLVRADCDPCAGVLRFGSASHRVARTLDVLGPGGRLIARRRLTPEPVEVEVPLRFRSRIRLTFRVSPRADAVPVAPGAKETRDLAVQMAEPRFVKG